MLVGALNLARVTAQDNGVSNHVYTTIWALQWVTMVVAMFMSFYMIYSFVKYLLELYNTKHGRD
jgi:hypothetical protein